MGLLRLTSKLTRVNINRFRLVFQISFHVNSEEVKCMIQWYNLLSSSIRNNNERRFAGSNFTYKSEHCKHPNQAVTPQIMRKYLTLSWSEIALIGWFTQDIEYPMKWEFPVWSWFLRPILNLTSQNRTNTSIKVKDICGFWADSNYPTKSKSPGSTGVYWRGVVCELCKNNLL